MLLARIQVAFDDHRLVDHAGLLLPATLGTSVFPNWYSSAWTGDAPGRANTGDKIMMVASALAGGDCIDDADAQPVGRPVLSTAWLRRHPHWALSCAASAGATSANWTG